MCVQSSVFFLPLFLLVEEKKEKYNIVSLKIGQIISNWEKRWNDLLQLCFVCSRAGVMETWWPGLRSEKAAAAMTECFLPPSSSPAEQRRAEHPGGVARTPSSEEISPTKFPGLYRTGEPSPPHDGHHHEPPDAYVSDDDKEHGKKKNKFKKKEKRSKWSGLSQHANEYRLSNQLHLGAVWGFLEKLINSVSYSLSMMFSELQLSLNIWKLHHFLKVPASGHKAFTSQPLENKYCCHVADSRTKSEEELLSPVGCCCLQSREMFLFWERLSLSACQAYCPLCISFFHVWI